jgi:hypothetical protein
MRSRRTRRAIAEDIFAIATLAAALYAMLVVT